MKVKVKEDLKVDTYYEGVMFVKGMEKYKGKIFNVEFVRILSCHEEILSCHEEIHLINSEGIDGGYIFSFPMLEIIEEDE